MFASGVIPLYSVCVNEITLFTLGVVYASVEFDNTFNNDIVVLWVPLTAKFLVVFAAS